MVQPKRLINGNYLKRFIRKRLSLKRQPFFIQGFGKFSVRIVDQIIVMKIFCRLLFVSVLFAAVKFSANAQLYKVELEEKISKSLLIVEGKVITKRSFWNDAHTMIFTANTVEVYKIFKGSSTKTIEVVTQGGTVGTKAVVVSDLLQLDENKTGIFFCYPNQYNLKSPVTKALLFDVYSSDQGFLRYDEKKDIAFAPFAMYSGIEKNVYSLIQQKTGRAINIINKNYKPDFGNISNVASGTLAASIGSFSPAIVHGGALNDPANNVLTINGSGFGASPSGLCAVRFKDGNSDNTAPDYSVSYTSSYLVSWSNTKIVIKVPGRAATGKIAVITSDGSITQSAEELDVFYSVLNAEFDFSSLGFDTLSATEPRLMNANSTGGYSIQYSTSTAGSGKNFNNAPEKITFQRALTTWKEQVGVNFTEGVTTSEQSVKDDNINIILFDNNNTGIPHLASGVLATTYGWFSVCYNTSPFKIFNAQKTGFDMIIRNNGVSSGTTAFLNGPCFPSSEIDLEMVILHELGHGLNLAHINEDLESSNGNNAIFINPGKLMHYAITNYVNRRSLDASSYQGSLYTVTKQNGTYGNCLATLEMTALSYTVVENDNCPLTFPVTATPDETGVHFDLVHATSNKFSDPQFTAVNCGVDNGQFVTNNAFYAIKTSSTATSLKLTISNYTTTPAEQNTCIGQGVRLAVYDVNTCPEGQQFPAPIACRTFLENGNLDDITGLQSNHNYLLYFDGLRNTKASFDAIINGDGTVPPPTGGKFSLKLISNPVRNNLVVRITDTLSGKYQFVLYDMLGKAVVKQGADIISGTQDITLPMVNLARAIYILKVIDGKGNVVAKEKIVKG
jgi:hypothetical protein